MCDDTPLSYSQLGYNFCLRCTKPVWPAGQCPLLPGEAGCLLDECGCICSWSVEPDSPAPPSSIISFDQRDSVGPPRASPKTYYVFLGEEELKAHGRGSHVSYYTQRALRNLPQVLRELSAEETAYINATSAADRPNSFVRTRPDQDIWSPTGVDAMLWESDITAAAAQDGVNIVRVGDQGQTGSIWPDSVSSADFGSPRRPLHRRESNWQFSESLSETFATSPRMWDRSDGNNHLTTTWSIHSYESDTSPELH